MRAALGESGDMFQIGERNIAIVRKLLWKNGIMLKKHDLGGSTPRTMSLDLTTGEVTLSVDGQTRTL